MGSRILVVEDSTTQAIALRAVLEEQGFEVERGASGEEALTYLARGEFDLVLSDIVMPGMSGYDLCRRIKADPRLHALPVVLLTSLSDPLDIVRGLECGADNYVTKPYESEHLAARIRNVLDRHRLRRSAKASLGVNVSFLGTTFSINSDKEQILDLFISSVEDVVRTNAALQESQRELAEAQGRLEEYARTLARQARVSEERYSTLMLEASDAIIVLDIEGRILEANVRASELFGRPLHMLRDESLESFAEAEGARALRDRFARLREAARVEAGEIEFIHATGDHFFCDVSASRTMSGEEELVFAILHDVTDLKETAERLRKSESLLMEAQRFAQLGSWEREIRTGESQWTVELFRILGLEPTSVVPSLETFLAVVHPGDRERVKEALDDTCRRGVAFNTEFRIVRRDGATRLAHARAEVLRDETGEIRRIRGTLQDVTDRKQLEEQLHQSQKIEAVGQLAGGIAHDFNNLLTVITSYCGIILSELPADADLRGDIEEIKGAADRAAGLTRQLLAFSRRQVLQPQVVDVNSLAENLEKLLRRLIREDIEFVTRLDPDIGVVWADPGQLEQVLVNLVVNARDAMPDGGTLTLRTSTTERAEKTGEYAVSGPPAECVLIEVSDTGTGMTPDVQARIFEPFFTTKPTGQGTGLGLSTVYGIVRQSGGDIEVDSTPDSGTTFRIYLPCQDRGPEAPKVRKQEKAARSQGETVLVVEDDAALRAVAGRILRRSGYRVLEARTGAEALELCSHAQDPVHVVLTDIVMPEMSGYELGEAIAKRHPDTRLLFMSGYSRDAGLRDGILQHGSDYIEKPFTVEGLAAKVREVLTRPAAQRR